MNSNEDKERVRDANDIVDVISGYVNLKASGKNFKGLCPFHQEKTPSFMVSPDRQSFKCFGCGVGGDVFEFLMRRESLTFPEAFQQLAARGHVTLTGTLQPQTNEADREKRQLYPILTWAVERFQKALQAPDIGKKARAYLQRRKIPEALIEKFKLGYAPVGWDNLLRAGARDHYSPEGLEKAGLVTTKENSGKIYDRFRERVMFPIFDLQGRAVAFGGRLLESGEPKYLNSPETPLFHKGELLYALNFAKESARSKGYIVLTEGYMDVIACHSAGVPEAVASLGTALTAQQAKLIKRYSDRVILLYDSDEAGIQASVRAFELLNQAGLQVRVATTPGTKDADEYIQTQGAEAFQQRLVKTQAVVEYYLDVVCRRYALDTVEGKLGVIREVGPLLLQFPKDGLEFSEYSHLVAERLRLMDRQVLAELDRLPGTGTTVLHKPVTNKSESDKTQARGVAETRKAVEEELIISTLLQFPMEIETFQEVIHPDLFTVSDYRELIGKIVEAKNIDTDDIEAWFPTLEAGLSLELAQLAKRLVALDRGTEDPARVLRDCLNRLQVIDMQEQLMVIQMKIKEVEKTGDMEALKQLQQENKELDVRLKQFGVRWK